VDLLAKDVLHRVIRDQALGRRRHPA
jgi:hypothetical protein